MYVLTYYYVSFVHYVASEKPLNAIISWREKSDFNANQCWLHDFLIPADYCCGRQGTIELRFFVRTYPKWCLSEQFGSDRPNWRVVRALITYVGANASQCCLIKHPHLCKWYLYSESLYSQLKKRYHLHRCGCYITYIYVASVPM